MALIQKANTTTAKEIPVLDTVIDMNRWRGTKEEVHNNESEARERNEPQR